MVTITDIAAALGVTPSTVSRALAGSPRVKPQTREAVLKTAAEMGYERNVMASSLRSGRSQIVGIVVPRIYHEFFSKVIAGAESLLREAGYNLMICQTHEGLDAEVKALKALRNNHVAAVLLSHSLEATDGSHIAEALGGEIPLVQFDRVFDSLPGAKVVNDNFEGAYCATRLLASNGYTRIGHFSGLQSCSVFRERLAGYRKALEDSGLSYDEGLVFHDAIMRESGREAAKKALECGCDAIYSAGAFSALGAMEFLRERGVQVPGEFGIAGTANESFTAITAPSLTTLDQHSIEMGREAAKAFLYGLSSISVVSMELKIRESSNRKTI